MRNWLKHFNPWRRQRKLERQLEDLKASVKNLSGSVRHVQEVLNVDEMLRVLGARTILGRPNASYLNERFRDYEQLRLNVKVLGYEIGRALAARDRERAPVQGPAVVPLTSRSCVQADFESPWFQFWCQELKQSPIYHRKIWELCYVPQALFNEGVLRQGAVGLGFGCGQEPLPSLFAKMGTSVLVTDQAPEDAIRAGWSATHQHTASVERARNLHICPDLASLERIDLRFVDMNDIPGDLSGRFDFCWSACALEHLGSIAQGLAFVENSVRTLKPGGVAVHTLEFNISDEAETIDNWPTVLFQKKHLVELRKNLENQGHTVRDLDFDLGTGVLDGFIDLPAAHPEYASLAQPWAHLKLSVDGFACTSFGIIVRAAG